MCCRLSSPVWWLTQQRITNTLGTEFLLCMENRAVLEAGCISCSDTGSASSAAHFWSQQMEEQSHWTEEALLSRALIRRRSEDWSLGLLFKPVFKYSTPYLEVRLDLILTLFTAVCHLNKKGNFHICCRLTIINIDGKSAQIYSNISEADDHYVICKYLAFSKTGTCGKGGRSGASLGDQVLGISFCYFQYLCIIKTVWNAEKQILDYALMQFFF